MTDHSGLISSDEAINYKIHRFIGGVAILQDMTTYGGAVTGETMF
jgi:hypothetical protein